MESQPQSVPGTQSQPLELTLEDQIAQYDKMLNVLSHANWREVFMYFAEKAYQQQVNMEYAASWDNFVIARAVKRFITDTVMALPDIVKAEKEQAQARLEEDVAEKAFKDAGMSEE